MDEGGCFTPSSCDFLRRWHTGRCFAFRLLFFPPEGYENWRNCNHTDHIFGAHLFRSLQYWGIVLEWLRQTKLRLFNLGALELKETKLRLFPSVLPRLEAGISEAGAGGR